jgi:arylsulfatase A-like enzyme
MKKFGAVASLVGESVMAGGVIGLLHVSILGLGGLFSLSPAKEIVLSYARYAGLGGLWGGLAGAVCALLLYPIVSGKGGSFPLGSLAVSLPYFSSWLMFLAVRFMGRISGLVVVILSLSVSIFVLVLAAGSRRAKGPAEVQSGPSLKRASSLLLAATALFLASGLFEGMTAGGSGGFGMGSGGKRDEGKMPVRLRSTTDAVSGEKWNLLLLTFDTLRADHLGCYGYGRNTSPNIDRLARKSVMFENAYCQRPKTSPSFATLFTGTYPSYHGIRGAMRRLSDASRTLAECLRDAGWTTAAVITNGNLYPAFGFDQGFDDYVFGHKDARTGADLSISWLERNAGNAEPWFLWVHFTDPHTPYDPPAPYDRLFAAGAEGVGEQVGLYDGEIRFADDQLGRILDWLEGNEAAKRTIVVFTADHGESLGEHNYYFEHGLHPYEPCAHVPLVMRIPGVTKASLCDALVGLVDVMPTILDALGLRAPEEAQGLSFLPILTGGEDGDAREFVYIEAGYGRHDIAGRTQALKKGSIKYVHRLSFWARHPTGPIDVFWSMNALLEGALAPDELYDLANDPSESINLIREKKDLAVRMKEMLSSFTASLDEAGGIGESTKAPVADEKTLESLRSLGYIE